MGVHIGETNILVHAAAMIGRKYVFGVTGKVTVEKQVIMFDFRPTNSMAHKVNLLAGCPLYLLKKFTWRT
jgi:hypothetical protein